MNKNEIRNFILKNRKRLHPYYVNYKSDIIMNNLSCILSNPKYKNILIYMAFKNEASLSNIKSLYPDKNYFIPKTFKNSSLKVNPLDENSIVPNEYGLLESQGTDYANPEILDLVLVPGVAFDKNLNRIGYGKGFYDIFLENLDSSILKVGVCYDFQLFDSIPANSHDIKMDLIITEKQTVISNQYFTDFSSCQDCNPEQQNH